MSKQRLNDIKWIGIVLGFNEIINDLGKIIQNKKLSFLCVQNRVIAAVLLSVFKLA